MPFNYSRSPDVIALQLQARPTDVICTLSRVASWHGYVNRALSAAQIEQAEDFLLCEAQGARPGGVGKDGVEQFALFLEHLIDALFNRPQHQEPRDRHWAGHANAMSTVDRLIFHRRVPPTIEQENVTAELQVKPHAAGAVTHQHHVMAAFRAELFDDGITPLHGNFAVIFQRVQMTQLAAQLPQRGNPLAENDRFLSAGDDFFQIDGESFEFCASARCWIKISDLFQPQHQFEHMLNGYRVAQFRQTQHTFVFGQLVTFPLFRRKFQFSIAK
jgi:hypothetical protein